MFMVPYFIMVLSVLSLCFVLLRAYASFEFDLILIFLTKAMVTEKITKPPCNVNTVRQTCTQHGG